jgi:predicted aminopeptidase
MKLTVSSVSRLIVLGTVALLGGCANLGYYAQAVDGHSNIHNKIRPIHAVIADPDADPALKGSLATIVKLREFASRKLKLPDNQSFTTYADLGRRYALWNVSATPELSLNPEKWCFVAIGCVSYRGFSRKLKQTALRTTSGRKAMMYRLGVSAPTPLWDGSGTRYLILSLVIRTPNSLS